MESWRWPHSYGYTDNKDRYGRREYDSITRVECSGDEDKLQIGEYLLMEFNELKEMQFGKDSVPS